MISTSNVTMRYGSKLLFEDVSVTFTSPMAPVNPLL